MIAVPGPALAPAAAARRAATQPGGFWLAAPAADEVGIARDVVGAAPVDVWRGGAPAEMERVWAAARAAWTADGAAPPAGVPAAVGWLSYELGRRLVGLPPRAPGTAIEGDAVAALYVHDAVWVRDPGGPATIFARDRGAAARLADVLARPAPATAPPALGPLGPEHPDDVFVRGVARVIEYLRAGDAYQVNLSRRLSGGWHGGDAVELAASLRARAPAPHAMFISTADGRGAVVGNSPERFLALDPRGAVETRPIKGTRARGATPDADRAAAAALRASAKDRAEHVMIVDLERNDLGRVCRIGSVTVDAPARAIALPTVHHLVSTVAGQLRAGVGLAALLAATFPGGSITGAPKRRAMQIIDELEPAPRGVYTGATGWLGAAGDADLAIAIRTAVVRDEMLSLSVGGGVVADSTPEGELAETEVKARAFAALAGVR